MTTTLESVWRPTAPQESFFRSKAKIRGFGGAMAGGKSRTLCEDKFDEALDYPGIQIVLARAAHTSIIETTRKTMLEQVIPRALYDPRNGGRMKASGGEDYIQLFNGSRIHFIGLENPLRWYSAEIGSIGFDECQEISEDTIVRLLTRLRQRCADCIRVGEKDCEHFPHRGTFAFNPESPSHYLRKWFIAGASQTEHGYRKAELFTTGATRPIGDCEFVVSKATDNPYLPTGYVEQTLGGLPERLRRRYLEGLWEFVSGMCFFDEDALGYYQRLADSERAVAVGDMVGDVVEDFQWRQAKKQGERKDPIRLQRSAVGPLMIWREPKAEHRYVMSIDVSSGGSYDYSAIQVVCVEDFEQVAEWQGKADPDLVAATAYRIGRLYNDALAAPEITGGWGFTIDQELKRLRYPRLYTRNIYDRLAKQWTDRTGWDTSTKTRMNMLDTLERVLREKEFGLYSLRCVLEMGAFVWSEKKDLSLGKPAAQPGENDDLVMALAIAVTVAASLPKQLRKKVRKRPAVAYPWQRTAA